MNKRDTSQDQQGLIVIEEDRLKESFTQIPNTILRQPGISAGAKLTYIVLISYAWHDQSCFPGQATLAEDLGAGRRSVIRYLQELERLGLLRLKRRGLGKTNVYTLGRWNPAWSARLASPEVSPSLQPEVPDWRTKKIQTKEIQKKEDSVSNPFDDDDQARKEAIPHDPGDFDSSASTAVAERNHGLTRIGLALQRLRPEGGRRRMEQPVAHPQEQAHLKGEQAHTQDSDGSHIEMLIAEFSRELGDAEHRSPNTSQALRLWRTSGRSEASFVQMLYESRSRTRQAGNVAHRSGTGTNVGIRKRMPYFFACLRDLLDQNREQRGRSLAVESG